MRLDTLITNARIADLYRLRVFEGWAGIAEGRFIYVEEGAPPADLAAETRLDAGGRILVPGLIDSHMHIESSLVTPRRFAEAALPRGTTTILTDPHEVANVGGVEAVRWMAAASRGLALEVFTAIPSCVPATGPEIEWTSAVFGAEEISALASDPTVIALGEVMDYQGLLGQNDRLPPMVAAALQRGLRVEGHIPTLTGMALSRYLAHGVTSDHTLTTPAKLLEQVSKGVAVMLQMKSITPENIATVSELADRSLILLVTDDIEPSLLADRHLDWIVRLAVEAGMPPLEALASASLRPARYLGLRDRGGIAPGLRADFLLMDDLTAFPPEAVYVKGQPVAARGAFTASLPAQPPPLPDYPAVPGPLGEDAFRFTGMQGATLTANVVTLENDRNSLTGLARRAIRLDETGAPVFERGDGLALVGVFARDGSSAALGFLQGAGLNAGAFASSLAHDSHNLFVIGRDPRSMAAAAHIVWEQGGGLAVTEGETLKAALALPLFGLLSDAPVTEVAAELQAVEAALRAAGMTHQRPFLVLSVLALTVSPYYKFSDRGVVDTERRALLPAWERA
ncbi:MAG: adenine deaminase [Anaerolineae bacterium]|nr:adenine deaminase [Anaerolineae bacterium]